MLSFLFSYEKPFAMMALQNSVTTIVMKTCGMSYVPSLQMMFDGTTGQYPKRDIDTTTIRSQQWDLFYLFMYGGFGLYAQYMGYLWTIHRNKETEEDTTSSRITKTSIHQARALGLFHVIIAIHHTLWAFIPGYGQLKLERFFGIPYWLEGLVAIMTGYHGYKLLTSSAADVTNEKQLRRHKIMVDFSSLCSLIPIFGFWPMNILGYATTITYERFIWAATTFVPLSIMGFDLFYDDSIQSSSSYDTKSENSKTK
jgi:hypothetical protein